MSDTQTVSEALTIFPVRRLGTIGRVCREWVVTLYLLFILARMPSVLISRATLFLLQTIPCDFSSLVTRGLPYAFRPRAYAFLIWSISSLFLFFLILMGRLFHP